MTSQFMSRRLGGALIASLLTTGLAAGAAVASNGSQEKKRGAKSLGHRQAAKGEVKPGSVNAGERSFVLVTKHGELRVRTDGETRFKSAADGFAFDKLSDGLEVWVQGAHTEDGALLARHVLVPGGDGKGNKHGAKHGANHDDDHGAKHGAKHDDKHDDKPGSGERPDKPDKPEKKPAAVRTTGVFSDFATAADGARSFKVTADGGPVHTFAFTADTVVVLVGTTGLAAGARVTVFYREGTNVARHIRQHRA